MPTKTDELKNDVYGGVRWSAVSAWGQQAIQFGISIVLARLLLPTDYGLLAMATIFIGFLEIFKNMGFHSAIIQRREVGETLLSSLFYFTLVLAGMLCLISNATAPFLAWINREPRVMPVTAVLGLSFLLSSPGLIPSALLNRQMRFGQLAIADLASAVVTGAVAIVLAVNGCGVWALVLSSLAGAAISTLLLFIFGNWHPRLIYRWSEVRRVFGFGANVTGFAIFNYFSRNADNFIIGVFLGIKPLGYYALAYGILLRPRDMVTGVLMRVLFPALSRLQDDDARLKAAYLRACGAIAFVTFPMMLGLITVVTPLVEIVLGEKWLPAVPLISIFVPLGMAQSIGATAGNLFLVKGRADWQFRWGLFSGILTVISFLLGVPWGVIGVAVSYTATSLILLPVGFYFTFLLVDGLRLRDIVTTLTPHVITSGAMAGAVIGFRRVLPFLGIQGNSHLDLILSIAFGVAAYALLVVFIRPPALKDVQRLLPSTSLRPAYRSVTNDDAIPDSSSG